MPLRVKKTQFLSGLSNSQGQAVIEYILLLVVSVSLVLGLTYQIFTPMKSFIDDYMGSYVQCLLDTGTLPKFGGDASAQAPEDIDSGCVAKFKNVAGNIGANDTSPSSSGSRSGGADSSNSHSNQSSDSSNNSEKSGNSNSESSTYAGSASRDGSRFVQKANSAHSGLEGRGSNGKVVEIAANGNTSNGFFNGNKGGGPTVIHRKSTSVSMDGLTQEQKKRLEKNAGNEGRTVSLPGDDLSPSKKKMLVKKPEPKAPVMEDDQPMTVGNFIRYLFIAALILALVIFIGGQALQMSKSAEK